MTQSSIINTFQIRIHTYYFSQEEQSFGGCGKVPVEGQGGGWDVAFW